MFKVIFNTVTNDTGSLSTDVISFDTESEADIAILLFEKRNSGRETPYFHREAIRLYKETFEFIITFTYKNDPSTKHQRNVRGINYEQEVDQFLSEQPDIVIYSVDTVKKSLDNGTFYV